MRDVIPTRNGGESAVSTQHGVPIVLYNSSTGQWELMQSASGGVMLVSLDSEVVGDSAGNSTDDGLRVVGFDGSNNRVFSVNASGELVVIGNGLSEDLRVTVDNPDALMYINFTKVVDETNISSNATPPKMSFEKKFLRVVVFFASFQLLSAKCLAIYIPPKFRKKPYQTKQT